ncbi:hypothetical protein COB11_00535 [Candidatus Aerophobetes bacterium]|uniref:Uncharacterized protein n=1 Tax=Aerophobetes bacterium TaxID=2030807 RepID=A0A2A4YMG6_UNCAE|nr:MAG: hypothetical protein COB11_00535 [Candidatus Aerophobetes bacterium]
MKDFIICSLLLAAPISSEICQHNSELKVIVEDAELYAKDCPGDKLVHIQPRFPKKFFEYSAKNLKKGACITLVYYPERSTFDRIIKDKGSFLSLEKLHRYKSDYRFKIEYMFIHRPLAHFKSICVLESFVEKTFSSTLTSEAINYYKSEKDIVIPTRCIVIVLKKL